MEESIKQTTQAAETETTAAKKTTAKKDCGEENYDKKSRGQETRH